MYPKSKDMDLQHICQCNNCNSLLYDENPKTDAIPVDVSNINVEILPMELLNEDGESYWGCGNCQTDGYLQDEITVIELPK